ncbi:hypothetical protein [Mailhella sp.]|uniref:hypothetical protein n=1 Tax=Mailhella sp. TaxID=1981029 RepID=UPI00406321D9
MSKKSNETCAVDAELLYETPSSIKNKRREKTVHKGDTTFEIERLFASYYKCIRDFERDMRKLKGDLLTIGNKMFYEAANKMKGNTFCIPDDFMQMCFYKHTQELADASTQLRIQFERTHRGMISLSQWIKEE